MDKIKNTNLHDIKSKRVKEVNRQTNTRKQLEKIKEVGKEFAETPVRIAKETIDSAREDEATRGQKVALKAVTPFSNSIMDAADSSRRADFLKQIAQRKRAEEVVTKFQEYSSKSGQVFDVKNITNGQWKAYHLMFKKDVSYEEFQKLTSNTERFQFLNKKDRKQLFNMRQNFAIEDVKIQMIKYAKETDMSKVFSSNEIDRFRNGEFFNFRTIKDVRSTRELTLRMLEMHPKISEDSKIKFRNMAFKDLKEYLLSKGQEPEVSNLVYTLAYTTGWEKQYSKIGGRRRKFVRNVYDLTLGNEISNSDAGRDLGMISKGAKVAKAGAKVIGKTTQVTYRVAHNTAENVAVDYIRSLKRTGQIEKAEFVKKKVEGMLTVENETIKTVNQLKSTPVRMIKNAGDRIKKSVIKTIGEENIKGIKNSMVYKRLEAFGKKVGKAKSALLTPFKLLGKAADFVKKKVMLPVIIVIAVILLLLILLSSLTLISNNSAIGGSVSSVIMDTPEHLKEFSDRYQQMDDEFRQQYESVKNGNARTVNKKGQAIKYGVNGAANSEGNQNEDYQNGVTLKYYVDGIEATNGTATNIEDALVVMTVIFQQNISSYHDEAMELLEAIHKSTHSYQVWNETSLYPCEHGCETAKYFCNEALPPEGQEPYWNSDLKYGPFIIDGDITDDKETKELVQPKGECEVCKEESGLEANEYGGCVQVDSPNEYEGIGKKIKYKEDGETQIDDTANPSIDNTSNGHTLCFHNGGQGESVDGEDNQSFKYGVLVNALKKQKERSAKADTLSDNTIEKCEELDAELSTVPDWILPYFPSFGSSEWAEIDDVETLIKCKNYDVESYKDEEDKMFHYYCEGHEHYGCNGHEARVCYGHVNGEIHVNIGSLDRMFDLGGQGNEKSN